MIATIQNIQKNTNDLLFPQLDVEVLYTDTNFERLYVFTLPHEKFSDIDSTKLEEMITVQGQIFKDALDKTEIVATKESELQDLINTEITI